QKSKRAIVDWKRFDVGRGHEVIFDQPDARSATLNRVRSAERSLIEGAIRRAGHGRPPEVEARHRRLEALRRRPRPRGDLRPAGRPLGHP
ncbi:hypothetical protein CNY89_28085, partial [Amaricoccus sp. HAR-UPW-R2A-40]